ncbi:DUF885 domain-containing protein [Sphingomonas colocasiae]|uniref:DUF885 family protein n=1 Tax=Sphingomonas colocasiae TaxID=1848973 RepID=A0ABS7PSA5_9SPHN|nr:DUF885 family protein [Sphingomonas colocasiae]MBY8824210.1 DUF885 family protein [Sphingomonas colocasiae]
MLNRRSLLSLPAVALLAGWPRILPAAGNGITALLEEAMRQALLSSPQLMTITGLDTGANAAARGKLDDRSQAGADAMRRLFAEMKAGLVRFDPKTLSPADWVNHQSALFLADTTLQSYGFGYGDPNVGVAIPYIVSQLSGAYRSVPSFLENQHPIKTVADADAYLSRLSAFAVQLDQESDRARADFATGVVPPDFVLRTTLLQLSELMRVPPERSDMVSALVRRAAAAGVAGEWQARAERIVAREIYPALQRQADLLSGALAKATADAGVWRVPQGEAYYRYAVRAATTTDLAGDEIHRIGLERVAELTAQADAILKARGLTQGSVAQRIAALRRDPAQLYADSDAGRAALIADLQRMADAMLARLPDAFGHLPRAGVTIQRMPLAIEAGSSGATYQPPSLDGQRPGLFSINLRNMAEWPRFDLPTLVYHEAVPGHHLQNALSNEAEGLPTLRRMPLFSSFSEGWALYAEQLSDEMGAYREDPLARLGYVASMMFRAARLVLDSGIHARRWTREQSIAYMTATLGNSESEAVREVQRYCVQPAQACSYMLGWRAWTAARTEAKARLGPRFDLRAFHDEGLLKGAMPLDVLTRVMADWRGVGAS